MKRLSLGMVAIIVVITIVLTLIVDDFVDRRRAEKELAQTPMIEEPIDPEVEPEDEPVAEPAVVVEEPEVMEQPEEEETIETEVGTIVGNRPAYVNSQGLIAGSVVEGHMNCTLPKKIRDSKKNDGIPGILCWGDSLTFGLGGDGQSYPSAMLFAENLEHMVFTPQRHLT